MSEKLLYVDVTLRNPGWDKIGRAVALNTFRLQKDTF